ncbi:MAG: Tad domain-containing protein [Chloroflexi bacterium]|nr:Tad domain-containing protein [Chloroflexota bacterium]
MIKKFRKNSEKGQAIILITFGIIGLIAIVGLMTDGGMLLIEYARLKRGIDSAAVAAAQQFRKNYSVDTLRLASENFLRLNQSDVSNVQIDTCDTAPSDAVLCDTPRRKLVRVTATRIVSFGFLRVIGLESTNISATSIGEAASVDLVLVIDTSGSMAYETTGAADVSDPGNPGDDPAACNASNNCQPMKAVKDVAGQFMDTLFFPYDRVAIVTMTSQEAGGWRDPWPLLHLSDNETLVRNTIAGIKVFEPQECNTSYGTCLRYCTADNIIDVSDIKCFGRNVGDYAGQPCPVLSATGNPTSCPSSNVGGAIKMAGEEFAFTGLMKQDSFWVVIALVGGPANATNGTLNLTDANLDGVPDDPLAFGWCPEYTWTSPTDPYCRNASFNVSMSYRKNADGTFPPEYDAVSYARDQADFVANPVTGTGVTVFTIGLGSLLRNAPVGDADAGEKLLEYIAETAGDTVNAAGLTIPANHGFYSFAPSTSDLAGIFAAIAENILTRISQ